MKKAALKVFNYRIKFRIGLKQLNDEFFQATIEEIEKEKKRRNQKCKTA